MVKIGFLGAASVGKTSILRIFTKYAVSNKIAELGDMNVKIESADFSGESILKPDESEKETKTIHPNKVVFKETKYGENHTLYAPGGDKDLAVVRMGIITISRIARQIVAVFSTDIEMEKQFEFFNDVRYFPKVIYAAINKYDLLESNPEETIEDMKKRIREFFAGRNITIKDFFITCALSKNEFSEYNDNAVKMILKIVNDHSGHG